MTSKGANCLKLISYAIKDLREVEYLGCKKGLL